VTKEEYSEKTIETLKLVGLEGFDQRMPSELSGGQQQRVAVARAIVLEPKVLLFDEPLSNLDAKLRRQVREDIRNLQQKLGVTTIYVTHDQEEALAISDKVIVMNEAVIAQEGNPKNLYNHPNTSFVANFIGDANIVEATIEKKTGQDYDIDFGGVKKTISSEFERTDKISLALRPETIEINQKKSKNTISAKVENVSFVGSQYQYSVSTSLGNMYVVSNETNVYQNINDEVYLSFKDDGISILSD